MLRFAPTRFAAVTSLALAASLPAQAPHPAQPPADDSNLIHAARNASNNARATASSSHSIATSAKTSAGHLRRRHTFDLRRQLQPQPDPSSNRHRYRNEDHRRRQPTNASSANTDPTTRHRFLAELLNGTGSNMILVHRDGPAPAELILTPRQGGPTPPNPNAAAFNDRPEPEDTPNQAIQPPQFPPPAPANPASPARQSRCACSDRPPQLIPARLPQRSQNPAADLRAVAAHAPAAAATATATATAEPSKLALPAKKRGQPIGVPQ